MLYILYRHSNVMLDTEMNNIILYHQLDLDQVRNLLLENQSNIAYFLDDSDHLPFDKIKHLLYFSDVKKALEGGTFKGFDIMRNFSTELQYIIPSEGDIRIIKEFNLKDIKKEDTILTFQYLKKGDKIDIEFGQVVLIGERNNCMSCQDVYGASRCFDVDCASCPKTSFCLIPFIKCD